MIKATKSFQTSDNNLFPSRILALTHEFKLELRGLIQQKTKSNSLTSTDVAAILANDCEQISETFHRYKTAINRAKAAQKQNV